MRNKVAILEDNLDRQIAMQAWLTAHFADYEHYFCDEAEPFIAWLRSHLAETLFISLDHHLDLKPMGYGRWFDPGTGRMVADYLATCAPSCPIVIHSTNRDAVIGMEMLLQENGWSLEIVQPYGDLVWVGESWWPAVQRSIASRNT